MRVMIWIIDEIERNLAVSIDYAQKDLYVHIPNRGFTSVSYVNRHRYRLPSLERNRDLLGIISRGTQIEFKPTSFIVAHNVKLSIHGDKLVNSHYRKNQGESSEAPVCETALLNSFAQSHWILLFVASLGLGSFTGFWMLFFGGCYFAFLKPHPLQFVLEVASMLFLAHA